MIRSRVEHALVDQRSWKGLCILTVGIELAIMRSSCVLFKFVQCSKRNNPQYCLDVKANALCLSGLRHQLSFEND